MTLFIMMANEPEIQAASARSRSWQSLWRKWRIVKINQDTIPRPWQFLECDSGIWPQEWHWCSSRWLLCTYRSRSFIPRCWYVKSAYRGVVHKAEWAVRATNKDLQAIAQYPLDNRCGRLEERCELEVSWHWPGEEIQENDENRSWILRATTRGSHCCDNTKISTRQKRLLLRV